MANKMHQSGGAARKDQGDRRLSLKSYVFSDLVLSFGRHRRIRIPFAIISGYGLLLGWSSVLLWSSGFAGDSSSDHYAHVLRACLLAAMTATLVVLSKAASTYDFGKTVRYALAIAFLSPWAGIASIAGLELYAAIPLWILTGVGNAMLLYLWHTCLVGQNQKRLILIMGGSLIISGMTLLAFHAFQPGFRHAIALLAPALSLLFFLGTIDDSRKRIREYRSKINSKLERNRFYRKELLLSTLCNGFVGFLGSCATMSVFAPYAVPAVGFAFALAGVVMIIMLMKTRKNVAFEFLGFLLPYTAFWLFVFALGPVEFKGLSIAAMVALFSCFEILSTSNISRNSRYLFSDYAQGLSIGRAYNRFAFLLGWVFGYAAITLWMSHRIDLAVMAFFLLGILSVGVLSRLFRLGLETRNSRRSATPMIVDDPESDSNIAVNHNKAALGKGPDKDTCTALQSWAKSCGLSPRETEVLILLSQGRNTRFISGDLFISTNTVKSHTYNIYGKLAVHSQQELIDLVQKHRFDIGDR